MHLPLTVSYYISRQFLTSFAIVSSIFLCLILLIDSVELLRKASSKSVPCYVILEMVFLKLPLLIQVILPFIVLLGSVLSFSALSRRYELVVLKSSGISAWEFLMPAVFSAFVIGILVITVFNPIACKMLERYQKLEARHFFNKKNVLEISDSGMWIKQDLVVFDEDEDEFDQDSEEGTYKVVIHAVNIKGEKLVKLNDVTALGFTPDERFSYRVDAARATLSDEEWVLKDARVTFADGKSEYVKEYKIPTNLQLGDIEKSFSDPETISFWELPAFIEKLSKTGFSAVTHKLHYYKLLSTPLFYAAMVLIGALFSLTPPRQGKANLHIAYSILIGFVIYFVSNLIFSLGLSGSLPLIAAAITPTVITGLLGFSFILHLEDG